MASGGASSSTALCLLSGLRKCFKGTGWFRSWQRCWGLLGRQGSRPVSLPTAFRANGFPESTGPRFQRQRLGLHVNPGIKEKQSLPYRPSDVEGNLLHAPDFWHSGRPWHPAQIRMSDSFLGARGGSILIPTKECLSASPFLVPHHAVLRWGQSQLGVSLLHPAPAGRGRQLDAGRVRERGPAECDSGR